MTLSACPVSFQLIWTPHISWMRLNVAAIPCKSILSYTQTQEFENAGRSDRRRLRNHWPYRKRSEQLKNCPWSQWDHKQQEPGPGHHRWSVEGSYVNSAGSCLNNLFHNGQYGWRIFHGRCDRHRHRHLALPGIEKQKSARQPSGIDSTIMPCNPWS